MSWTSITQNLGLSHVPVRWLKQPLHDASNFIECFTLDELNDFLNKTSPAPDVAEALRQCYQTVGNHPSLALLFVHCHHVYFQSPGPISGLGELAPFCRQHNKGVKDINLFWALLLISGVPKLRNEHAALGLSETITYDTVADIYPWIETYKQQHGQFGFEKMGWLGMHFSNRLFTLGRLQFEPMTWQRPELALYNAKENTYVILAADTANFRPDGQYNGANGIVTDDTWMSQWKHSDTHYQGHPIDHRGKAMQDPKRYSKTEWSIAIEHGNDLLSVHIPASGSMGHQACGDSFQQALSLFPELYPDRIFKGFYCHSWLLDWQLTQYLNDGSNIVKFMKEWYLVPCRNTDSKQTLERVFGSDSVDLGAVEPKSSLQHAVLSHIKGGGQWRSPEGFMFSHGFNWGNQPY